MEDPTQANPVPAMPDSLLARPRIKLYSGKQSTDRRTLFCFDKP